MMGREGMLANELTAVKADSVGQQGALQKEQHLKAELQLALTAKDKVRPASICCNNAV